MGNGKWERYTHMRHTFCQEAWYSPKEGQPVLAFFGCVLIKVSCAAAAACVVITLPVDSLAMAWACASPSLGSGRGVQETTGVVEVRETEEKKHSSKPIGIEKNERRIIEATNAVLAVPLLGLPRSNLRYLDTLGSLGRLLHRPLDESTVPSVPSFHPLFLGTWDLRTWDLTDRAANSPPPGLGWMIRGIPFQSFHLFQSDQVRLPTGTSGTLETHP